MAGYDWMYGMSNNAVLAYECGQVPLSALKSGVLARYGIDLPVSFVKFLIKTEFIMPECYHHTSKFYNETDFYSLESLKDELNELEPGELDELKERFKEFKLSQREKSRAVQESGVKVEGTYIEWTGTRNYPKKKEVKFIGVKRGDWIFLENGKKKKVKSKWIKFQEIK